MSELFLSDARAYIQDIVAWSVCIAALIWGAGPERAVALVWLVLFELLNTIYGLMTGGNLLNAEVVPFYAIVDLGALICWVGIALYANRNYTLWIAAMQVLAMTAHLARGLVEAISPVAYVTMVAVPGWFQLLLLAAGLSRHILRKRRFGEYRDWRISPVTNPIGANASSLLNQAGLQQEPRPTWRDELK